MDPVSLLLYLFLSLLSSYLPSLLSSPPLNPLPLSPHSFHLHFQELDQATKLLLNKCMETSAFIRDDVELSLTTMVECTSLQRALQALIASGTELVISLLSLSSSPTCYLSLITSSSICYLSLITSSSICYLSLITSSPICYLSLITSSSICYLSLITSSPICYLSLITSSSICYLSLSTSSPIC